MYAQQIFELIVSYVADLSSNHLRPSILQKHQGSRNMYAQQIFELIVFYVADMSSNYLKPQ
jgi:hypothetical protein